MYGFPGLPSVGKTPPLNMVSPAAKIQRTTATVPPLNQTVSPSASVTPHSAAAAMNATRSSSFAAALRKLAKQAGDPPEVGGGILRDSARDPSPVSAVTSPRTPTPKRAHPSAQSAGVYNSSTSIINSPPVVTIAPTPSYNNTAADSRKSVDRATGGAAPSSTASNAAMIEPLGIKTEREKLSGSGGGGGGPAPGGHDRRDEERPRSKDASLPKPLSSHPMLNSSAVAPGVSGAGGSRDEAAPRGFQPYRPGDDLRHTLPPHFSLDAATAAAAYSAAAAYPAFMPPHLSHPALRFDDPLLLERYRMMQSPLLSGIPGYPSMLPHPGIPPLLHPSSRYPPELLAQHYPLMSPKLPDHRSPGAGVERKSEEEERREREGRERLEREERERERREREEQERRERERLDKERQERERLERERQERERQERERAERERLERERERERQLSLERLRAHDAERKSPARNNDETGRYVGSITSGTPRDALYGDKYRNAVYPTKPFPGLGGAGVEERLTQSHLADKERGRQFMHEQYLRQQEALMREQHELEKDHEARDKAVHNTHGPKDDSRHARTSEAAAFHRPLTNGYEHNHISDYDRRLMTENILAQDRQILQDQQRPRSRPNSGHNNTSHSDSRGYDQVNDRAYLDRQHEGMQARLIESEKSREHQVHLYNRRLNQYDYDRPHAESQPIVAASYPHHSAYGSGSSSHAKDSSHTSSRHDSRELRVPDPSNYFRFDAPVLSKLDLEEKKMREARMNGMYNSDDSASESDDETAKDERQKDKLLVIGSGPPCKLDKSPKKLKYLEQFGLTTKEQKKELDYERFTKRRKLYKESSVSPVQVGDELEVDESLKSDESASPQARQMHTSSLYDPDQLNREHDYQYKCRFFYSIGLQRVTPERRREMDRIRQVCLEDRRRRLGIKSHGDFKNISSHSNHILQDQVSYLKRKHSEMESGVSHLPHRPKPQRITLGQLHERHLQQQQHAEPSRPSHPPHTDPNSTRAVIYPAESHDAKLRSREFAQEFHKEVLQATVKKEISKNQLVGRPGSQSELRYSVESLDTYRSPAAVNSSASQNSNVIHSTKVSSTHEDSHQTVEVPFKWPGIEAVLESYQKHCEEQRVEQGILVEQCHKLQRTNAELHRTAESLSRRMADLMQTKSRAEDDRLRTQTSIDNLKKSLKVLR